MSGFDLNVDAGRQIKTHQGIKGRLSRLDDVNEAFVGADLELLAALLVDVGSTQHRVAVDARRQWHWAGRVSACPPHSLDDLDRALVEQLVVIGLEADANLLGHLSDSVHLKRRAS